MIPAHLLHPDCSLGSMGVAGCVWIQGFLEANPKIGLGSKAHLLGFAPGWEKVPQDPNVLPFWKTELRDKFLVHSSRHGSRMEHTPNAQSMAWAPQNPLLCCTDRLQLHHTVADVGKVYSVC